MQEFNVQGFILFLALWFGWLKEVSFGSAVYFFTRLSNIPASMPRSVALRMVRTSSLKFASITHVEPNGSIANVS